MPQSGPVSRREGSSSFVPPCLGSPSRELKLLQLIGQWLFYRPRFMGHYHLRILVLGRVSSQHYLYILAIGQPPSSFHPVSGL